MYSKTVKATMEMFCINGIVIVSAQIPQSGTKVNFGARVTQCVIIVQIFFGGTEI